MRQPATETAGSLGRDQRPRIDKRRAVPTARRRSTVGVGVGLEPPHGRIVAQKATHSASAHLLSWTAGLVADSIFARGTRPCLQANRRTGVAARTAVGYVGLDVHTRRGIHHRTSVSGRAGLHGVDHESTRLSGGVWTLSMRHLSVHKPCRRRDSATNDETAGHGESQPPPGTERVVCGIGFQSIVTWSTRNATAGHLSEAVVALAHVDLVHLRGQHEAVNGAPLGTRRGLRSRGEGLPPRPFHGAPLCWSNPGLA